MNMPCSELVATMGKLFDCAPAEEHIRVRTPFMYPDGDVIDLFCYDDNGDIILTDFGETLRWLSGHSAAVKRTDKQSRQIADICKMHGVDFVSGEFRARATPGVNIAQVITELSQACLRVSDLWFTMKYSAVSSVADDVAEFLLERNIGFERRVRVTGESQRQWDIDFRTWTPERRTYVQLLATGSRAVVHKMVEHTYTAWGDLSYLRSKKDAPEFITLFDDTVDVWKEEDISLVERMSRVAMWSRPDDFVELLRAG